MGAGFWAGGIMKEGRLGGWGELCKIFFDVFVRRDLANSRLLGVARMRYGQRLTHKS